MRHRLKPPSSGSCIIDVAPVSAGIGPEEDYACAERSIQVARAGPRPEIFILQPQLLRSHLFSHQDNFKEILQGHGLPDERT